MAGPTDDTSVVADVEVSYLASKQVGDEFKLFVARTAPDDPLPPQHVLVVTDAQLQYGAAVEMARLYRLEQVPPLLVVGIGYRAKYFGETIERRRRDLTPVPGEEGGGGAPAFLAFLADELKPHLAERYRVAAADYTLFGNSLGGLFATWALLTRPQVFGRYGIGSPSYWWGDRAILETEAAYAAAHDDLPARVFIGIGAMENPAGDLHAAKWLPEEKRAAAYAETEADTIDMVADVALMVSRLERRHYPSLELERRTHADEYHATAQWLNLSWALRSLFDTAR